MRVLTKNIGLAVAVVLAAASGCTSILGDFTSGSGTTDGGSPQQDGSPDGPATSEGGLTDGSSDGGIDGGESDGSDAALPTLSCTTWKYPNPIVIDDLSQDDVGSTYLNGAFWTGSPSPGLLRIVTERGYNEVFTMYTYDRATETTVVLNGPPPPNNGGGGLYGGTAVHHFSLGPLSGVTLASVNINDPTNGSGYEIFTLDDQMQATGPAPSPILFYQSTAQNFGNSSNGSFFPFDENDIFGTVAYQGPGSPPEYYLGAGRATNSAQATLGTVSDTVFSNAFQGVQIVHAGTSLYLFSENANQNLGESAWVIPDTASVPTEPPVRAFSSGSVCTIFDVAPSVAHAASTNFAYAQGVAGQDTFTSLSVSVGAVPNASLATVVSTDLSLVRTYTNTQDAPFGQSQPLWQGDDMLMIGAGLPSPDGGILPGLNFLWVDANADVRAEQVGSNAILQMRSNIQEASATIAAATATSAQIDVVWVEDVGNTHNVIYYNQLDCALGD